MGNKRQPLSKKIRFEVFKRDKFTCQYCGSSAPDVILEVDHIKPVAEGGKNELFNLITSCRDCNRGKGKRKLDDNTEVQKQQKMLAELAEKNEQLEMLMEWRTHLLEFKETSANKVAKYFESICGCSVNEYGINHLKKWINEYGVDEILTCIEISMDKYSDQEAEFIFSKIPKIASVRKASKKDPQLYYFNYLKKCIKSEFAYVNFNKLHELIYENIFDDESFECAKRIFKSSSSWTNFVNNMEDYFECEG